MNEMEEVARGTARALQAGARMRAMIEACREYIRDFHPSDITPIPLARAVCHPILGGKLRANPANDVPGPTFTVNSLRRAAGKGELETVWNGSNQYVTPLQLRAWVTRSATGRAKVTPPSISYMPPEQRTLYEKQRGSASVATASAKLAEMRAERKKGRK